MELHQSKIISNHNMGKKDENNYKQSRFQLLGGNYNEKIKYILQIFRDKPYPMRIRIKR
jgi:hypothetical protein